MTRRYRLADIASESYITRCSSNDIQKIEKILQNITPDTKVTDGYISLTENKKFQVYTMRELALAHKMSVLDDEIMSDTDAWGWANADLVFGRFYPVE